MALPEGIPTVTVTGRYLRLDGTPLSGRVVFRAPALLTFGDQDVIMGGPVFASLDAQGAFRVTLPATHAPGMVPADWSYSVAEELAGVGTNRTYNILLPADVPQVDIADIAPTNPHTPTYVAVRGDSAYEVAQANGFTGTEAEWVASLRGPMGPPGPVATVAGLAPDADGDVPLSAPDVGAVPDTAPGAPGGVAQLDDMGRLLPAQRPAYNAADVGALPASTTAAGIGALPATARGAAGGVAALGPDGKVPPEQLPPTASADNYNARSYGAQGNGTANDAGAIQAALNAARDAGGGWVLIPRGTYNVATLPLRIYRNTRLTLLPGATLRRGTTGTFLINGDASQTHGGYTGHGDIVIEGGVWDMRATAAPTNPDMCISIGHARNIVVRDLEIRDVGGYHAIEINSTKHGRIEACQFRGYLDTGSRDFSEAVQFDGAFRASVFGGFGPYDGTVCEDVVMTGCYVGASGTAGTVAWPSGVGSHSAVWGQRHRRIRIEGNTFEGGAQAAVKPYIWDGAVITGNNVSGCGAGVQARTLDSSKTADRTDMAGTDRAASQTSTGLAITGNVFRDLGSFDDAIQVEGEATGKYQDVTITGNTITGVGGAQNGVRMVHVDHGTVASCTLRSIGGTAVSTANCSGLVVTGNRIAGVGGSWFTNDAGSDITFANNRCTDAGAHGVWSFGGAWVHITGNYLRGAGRADATANGVRLSTAGSDRITVTGNTYRAWGTGTEAGTAFSASSAVTNLRRYGNTWTSGTVSDTSTTGAYSPYDADKQPA